MALCPGDCDFGTDSTSCGGSLCSRCSRVGESKCLCSTQPLTLSLTFRGRVPWLNHFSTGDGHYDPSWRNRLRLLGTQYRQEFPWIGKRPGGDGVRQECGGLG